MKARSAVATAACCGSGGNGSNWKASLPGKGAGPAGDEDGTAAATLAPAGWNTPGEDAAQPVASNPVVNSAVVNSAVVNRAVVNRAVVNSPVVNRANGILRT